MQLPSLHIKTTLQTSGGDGYFRPCSSLKNSTQIGSKEAVHSTTMTMLLLLSVLLLLRTAVSQYEDCPDEWVAFQLKCYRFVMFPEHDHDTARAYCGANGAALVGVNSQAEHQFLSGWLMSNDMSRREFYTSGLVRNMAQGDLVWESDGSRIAPDLQYWLSEEDRLDTGPYITYKYGVTTYGWSRAAANHLLPFICEISREEAYRIIEDSRDFDYGLDILDPNDVPRGPKFIDQPDNIMAVEGIASVVIDCTAAANPSPTYRMYKILVNNTIPITTDMDPRYVLTNGKLVIRNPTESKDAGRYICTATNPYGTVISQIGLLSFGILGEFSNVQREKVQVKQHSFGMIKCLPPSYRPEVGYGWMKYSPGNFIRTDLLTHLFVSANGNLYFSDVTTSDAAVYYCMVKLMPPSGTPIATAQPPSRVSMAIELQVTQTEPSIWGPQIADDFPAVYPRQPLRGQEVRLECLAYGTMTIRYYWSREKLPLPTDSYLLEENRVLIIPNVQVEDAGVYVCHASRGGTGSAAATAQKSIRLNIESSPYYIYDLHDKHVDEGRRVTWRCEARGVPAPTYTWFKDGESLQHVSGDVEILSNTLTVVSPDAARHNGMYQCRASNTHGTVYSTGQMRVLGFKPTFTKHPVQSITLGARGGTATIRCPPEAAPKPEITWYKNGASVGSTEATARIRILSNGNIVISNLIESDSGTYMCQAVNVYGQASSSGKLDVLAQTTISTYPRDTTVQVNHTAFLSCVVSHDPELDLQTDWLFQGKPLYWKDAHYRKGSEGGLSGLYIQGCQRRHAGQYTCLAVTTFDTVTANATLTVVGPPSEPAGLTVETSLDYTSRSVTLRWTPGDAGGSAVTSWTIQAATDFNPAWTFIMQNVPDSSTIVQGRERREITITELRPWTAYKFRVSARNAHGLGPYSVPSAYHQTSEGPPTLAPGNITAGEGSKLGDLSITWTPLREEDHGGAEFGYNVYYRLHDRPGNWQKGTVGDVGSFVVLVGKENFYTLYEVMVQPFNRAGAGPNSSVATIYSAEDLPIGTPGNILIFPHNSSALDITWIPVPDTKEAVRGKILGYQVNYWEDVTNPLIMSHYTGEASSGATVIGLLPNTMYVMDVQVYNSAGLGPVSEKNKQRTYNSGMTSQPTEVTVSSHGTDSVYVTWRGISRKQNEETLVSYTISTWPYTDNIRTAEIVFTGRNEYGVVRGLKKDVLYKLRVCPINLGGDGASSVELLITLGGLIRYDTTKTDILAGVGRQGGSLWTVILLLASYLLL